MVAKTIHSDEEYIKKVNFEIKIPKREWCKHNHLSNKYKQIKWRLLWRMEQSDKEEKQNKDEKFIL